MINKFEKQLEKWNNGVLRGAQAKLARCLHVSTATVALWTTGKRHPSKGYLSQLGKIFNMDSYDVSRLFLPNSPLMSSFFPQKSTGLHDSTTPAITYSADTFKYKKQTSNSLALPFFLHLPTQLPLYQEHQVAEWWTLPRRAAQGAQFLIHAGGTDISTEYAEDILFIMPSNKWVEGSVMLARKNKKYLIRQITTCQHTPKWKKMHQKETIIPNDAQPIGVVVEKLTFTIL